MIFAVFDVLLTAFSRQHVYELQFVHLSNVKSRKQHYDPKESSCEHPLRASLQI